MERLLNSQCMVLTTQEDLVTTETGPTLGPAPVLFTITYPDLGTLLALFTHPSRAIAGGDQVNGFRFAVRCAVGELLCGLPPILGIALNPYTQYNCNWSANQMERVLQCMVRENG